MCLGQLRVPFLRFVGHVNTKTNIADKTLSNNVLLETNSFLIPKEMQAIFTSLIFMSQLKKYVLTHRNLSILISH